jgi:hypothetical protein
MASSPLRNNLLNTETPGKHIESMVAHFMTPLQSCDRSELGSIRRLSRSPTTGTRFACGYVAISVDTICQFRESVISGNKNGVNIKASRHPQVVD